MTSLTVNGSLPATLSNGASPDAARSHGSAYGEASSYLQYLPGIYRQDPFIGRFLHIFEDVLAPIQRLVSTRTQQFDPSLASPPMLEALSAWIGAGLAEDLPEARARQFIKNALLLHRWRGTKTGLRLALKIATGMRPYISEFSQGLVLGSDAALGINTALVQGQPLQIFIAFDCDEKDVDMGLVHAIIQRYKPAATTYSVTFRP